MNARLPFLLLLAASTAFAAPATRVPTFRAVTIDDRIQIGYGVAVADVNGDGRPDILLADKNVIAWYENPAWRRHIIAENLTPRDHVCIAAADIDGDGKCEIAVGAGWNPGDTVNSGAIFYLIPPADRTQRWESVALPHEPTVHRMHWVKNFAGRYVLVVVPLHGRGNKPQTGEGAGVRVLAYHPPANPRDPWKTELLDDSKHKTHNFDPVQWDSDPAGELLLGSMEGVFLIDPTGPQPTLTQLAGNEGGGAGEVRAGRLAGGRRFIATIEPMHGTTLAVYTPPARAAAGALWTRHVVDETLLDGHALACGDLAGTGSDQIVVGWRGGVARVAGRVGIKLFTPLDETGTRWQETLIDDNTMACEDLVLADLDGDGRLDIIAAGRATKNLKVYFNEGVK
jgi:hypothetical protein